MYVCYIQSRNLFYIRKQRRRTNSLQNTLIHFREPFHKMELRACKSRKYQLLYVWYVEGYSQLIDDQVELREITKKVLDTNINEVFYAIHFDYAKKQSWKRLFGG